MSRRMGPNFRFHRPGVPKRPFFFNAGEEILTQQELPPNVLPLEKMEKLRLEMDEAEKYFFGDDSKQNQ